jgi:putative FmdB family regulatory protein
VICVPTYVYGCEACGNETDLMRPIQDRDDPADCPCCGGTLKRLIAIPAGLIGRAVAPGAVLPSEAPGAEVAGDRGFHHAVFDSVFTNFKASGNEGAAIAIEGPFRVKVDGAAMTNTREGFRLSDGAMVEASNIRYAAGKPSWWRRRKAE